MTCLRDRSLRRAVAAVLVVAGALGGCGRPAGDLADYWGQAQGRLAVFGDRPLVTANWTGRYRPWVLDGERLVPVLDPAAVAPDDLDLHAPLPLSETVLLLAGSRAGRPFDLYSYDPAEHVLANLTASPEVDDGDACADPARARVAWRAGSVQRFAALDGGLLPLGDGRVPAFRFCVFAADGAVLGVVPVRDGWSLRRCDLSDGVRCTRRHGLDGLEDVTGLRALTDGGIAVIGRARGAEWRRAWRLSEDGDGLAPAPLPPRVRGDVLDWDGDAVRFGFESRYHSTLAPEDPAVVSATARTGDTAWAIVAGPRQPRTLARLVGGRWQPIAPPGVTVPADTPEPHEQWITSAAGQRYQTFVFGPPADDVVLWWHGGPHENVSPRFHPYFTRLHQLGFTVVAVNYPGSTGRGRAYEQAFDAPALADCVAAVAGELRAHGARRVVSWSVSSGNVVQEVLLRSDLPLSAVVDQAGWGRSRVAEEAARRGVPLFSIRGRQDAHADTSVAVDHWYDDGHDVVTAAEATAMFSGVEDFLQRAGR